MGMDLLFRDERTNSEIFSGRKTWFLYDFFRTKRYQDNEGHYHLKESDFIDFLKVSAQTYRIALEWVDTANKEDKAMDDDIFDSFLFEFIDAYEVAFDSSTQRGYDIDALSLIEFVTLIKSGVFKNTIMILSI